ncbi:MAG: hypothetical protein ACTSRA_23330 [Promethearchaeota archaeon]
MGIDKFKAEGKWNEYLGPPIYGMELRYDGVQNKFFFHERIKNPLCWICGKTYK